MKIFTDYRKLREFIYNTKWRNFGTSGKNKEYGKHKYVQKIYTFLLLLNVSKLYLMVEEMIMTLSDVVLNGCKGNSWDD